MKLSRVARTIAGVGPHLYALSEDGAIFKLIGEGSTFPRWELLPSLPEAEVVFQVPASDGRMSSGGTAQVGNAVGGSGGGSQTSCHVCGQYLLNGGDHAPNCPIIR